ncbi:hypothetical protein C8R44DRAFT_747877 [Mycena epipterygia]|nr:hypothetical protein C8R44DRAFT_747877 [Mycena epipterygia]
MHAWQRIKEARDHTGGIGADECRVREGSDGNGAGTCGRVWDDARGRKRMRARRRHEWRERAKGYARRGKSAARGEEWGWETSVPRPTSHVRRASRLRWKRSGTGGDGRCMEMKGRTQLNKKQKYALLIRQIRLQNRRYLVLDLVGLEDGGCENEGQRTSYRSGAEKNKDKAIQVRGGEGNAWGGREDNVAGHKQTRMRRAAWSERGRNEAGEPRRTGTDTEWGGRGVEEANQILRLRALRGLVHRAQVREPLRVDGGEVRREGSVRIKEVSTCEKEEGTGEEERRAGGVTVQRTGEKVPRRRRM